MTSIESYAFRYCTGLTSIAIPDSVTSIGNQPFYGCTGLTDVTVDEGNTCYYSENNCIIEKDTNTLILGCKNSIISDSVTNIGYSAFYGCTGLTSITIPDSVTSIGDSAFSGCTGLTSIIIPDSVTSIGSSAFSGCTGLTSIIIPDSVTSIGSSAFSGCTGLTNLVIPASVTHLNWSAFDGCTKLAHIYCEASSKPEDWYEVNDIVFENFGGVWWFDISLGMIRINKLPNKTVYYVGESLDASGLVIDDVSGNGDTQTIVNGYTLSEIDMTTAGKKTVTVTFDGKTAAFEVTINEKPAEKLQPKEDSELVIEEKTLTGVGEKTKVEELASQFNGDVKVFTAKGAEAKTGSVIGTGSVIRLYDGETAVDELTVIVKGDLDGDGVITAKDYVLTKRAFLKTYALSDAASKAARVSGGETVTTKDYVLIKRVFLKTYTF